MLCSPYVLAAADAQPLMRQHDSRTHQLLLCSSLSCNGLLCALLGPLQLMGSISLHAPISHLLLWQPTKRHAGACQGHTAASGAQQYAAVAYG